MDWDLADMICDANYLNNPTVHRQKNHMKQLSSSLLVAYMFQTITYTLLYYSLRDYSLLFVALNV